MLVVSRLSWLTRLRRRDLIPLAWLIALIACAAPSLWAHQPETRAGTPEMAPVVEEDHVEEDHVEEDHVAEDHAPAAEAGDWMSQLSRIAVPDRGPSEHSRNHSSVLLAFRDVVGLSAKCTVRIFCQDKQVALGTIFDADGFIATKGSELNGPVQCELADGTRCAAELLGVDRGSDLAVLKIPAQGLPAIRWREDDPPAVGSWVVTPGLGALPEAVGIVSVAPHQVRGAILGIQLTEDKPGPRVTFVVPGSGAASAGLLRGDVITHINAQTIEDAEALVAATSAMLPGDNVTLTIQRANQTEEVHAVLGSVANTLSSYRARLQDGLGGPLSGRRVLFPSALEHDTVLLPNQCGGPLVDLDGKVIGINIARANRVASYAIPAHVARPLLESFKTRTVVTVSNNTFTVERSTGVSR
jgi:serine protease Do